MTSRFTTMLSMAASGRWRPARGRSSPSARSWSPRPTTGTSFRPARPTAISPSHIIAWSIPAAPASGWTGSTAARSATTSSWAGTSIRSCRSSGSMRSCRRNCWRIASRLWSSTTARMSRPVATSPGRMLARMSHWSSREMVPSPPRRGEVKGNRALSVNHLVPHHEWPEQRVHFVRHRLARRFRHAGQRHRRDAAVAAMGADLDLAVDAALAQRGEEAGEDARRGVPAQFRFEHFADAGERHRIDRDDLHRDSGALGRALAHPAFEFARLDLRARLELHIADRQFAGIGIGLSDHGGEADGGMLEHDLLDRRRIDIVAAADHEILGAAGDPEKAVGIEPAEIAGIDPVSVDKGPLVVRVVEIAAEHAGAGHDHDPDLVRGAVALE